MRAFFTSNFGSLSFCFWLIYLSICILLCGCWLWIGKDFLALSVGLLGISSAFFVGKGRVIGLYFALIYDVLSSVLIVNMDYRLWGDVGLNIFYALNALYGILKWRNQEGFYPRFLSPQARLGVVGVWILGGVGAYMLLHWLGSNYVFAESLISIGCLLAFCLQVRKYVEAYILYTLCNLASVGIWLSIFSTTPQSITQLLSSIVFLGIGIYYAREWMRKSIHSHL